MPSLKDVMKDLYSSAMGPDTEASQSDRSGPSPKLKPPKEDPSNMGGMLQNVDPDKKAKFMKNNPFRK